MVQNAVAYVEKAKIVLEELHATVKYKAAVPVVTVFVSKRYLLGLCPSSGDINRLMMMMMMMLPISLSSILYYFFDILSRILTKPNVTCNASDTVIIISPLQSAGHRPLQLLVISVDPLQISLYPSDCRYYG
jgi:hypothetical protein